MTTSYYQKHKERLQKEARNRYQNLSLEENKVSWWRTKGKKWNIWKIISSNIKNNFVDFRGPEQLILFYGLVLEMWRSSKIFYQFKDFFTIKNFLDLLFDLPQVATFPTTLLVWYLMLILIYIYIYIYINIYIL